MKIKKWTAYIFILIIIIVLIFFVDWNKEGQGEVSQLNTSEVPTTTTEQELECPEVVCKECEESEDCDDQDCDACDSCCPSCPSSSGTTTTVIEGAEELASTSLVSLEKYNNRVINIDEKNLTYWLYNTKDYKLSNIHTKLVITINDDTKQTVLSEVTTMTGKNNKSFKLPIDLAARDEVYKAKLTIYSANNEGLNKDIEFKVYDLNPDIEESKAFWQNSIVGFSDYVIKDTNINLTLVNNKNSDVDVNYIRLGDKQWLLNETLVSGQEFEFLQDVEGFCNAETYIYSLPIYMNYSSAGFEFEITEEQELVGYCE